MHDNNASISLPKGGGAIKGIGETFQPNLFSGTGNFSIPIFTSPSRGGFSPQLSLQYSTGNGNGLFGLGWNLSVPRITRKTEKGLPKYTDEDVFVMSGAEDLVVSDKQIDEAQQPAIYHITRYRPRTEGLFARIEKWVDTNDSCNTHWRATTKENITSIYGKTVQARVFDPEHPDHIYEWLLEETFDAKGNHIYYEYAKEDESLASNHIYETNRSYTSQRYIRRILYGNTPDGIKVGPSRSGTSHLENYKSLEDPLKRYYLFELLFDYMVCEDDETPVYIDHHDDEPVEIIKEWSVRDDPFSSFRSGFEIRTLRRCERVLMFHHFSELGKNPTLVKSTDFTYENDLQTKFSILSSATITGYLKRDEHPDSYSSSSMPPVAFKYSQFTPHEQQYQSVTARGDDMPPLSLKDPQTTYVDLFGDGLPDVLNTTINGYYYWQNLGDGQLDMRRSQHKVPAGVTLSQSGVAFGDMGGDGTADLIVQWPEMAGFYESTPDGNWKSFKKFDTYPSFSLSDSNVRLLDLTGDGRSDILMTRDRHFLWFECLGEAGYASPKMVMRNHDLDLFPDVYFNDPSARVRLADMTGDGLNDIVLLHNGRIDYWSNLGYGKFGKRITMNGSPRLEYNFDPARLFLADIDGSGCADLVYVDTGKVHFWLNQSGNSWSEEQVIYGTPPVTDFDSVQFADIFGTGTATLVWSYDHNRYPGENYKALDLCDGKKPYVLNEMSNNMGATTKVQYAPSTKFYLEDKKNGTPWITNLPFPVHVVEKVEVIDHISKTKLVTTYKYHHGYYDGKEREFRGFGRVDQFDTETFDDFTYHGLHGDGQLFTNGDRAFHVPPVETRSWFHTGVYFDEDRPDEEGKPFDHHKLMEAYKQEFYAGDTKAFSMDDQIFHGIVSAFSMESPHEIFRALRGAALRTEVYARDGSAKEIHPYAVTQNRYQVKEVQPKGNNFHAVYLTTQKESISYHYERNPDDPRVGHDITLAIDEFGNVTKKISIGYPRRNVSHGLSEQGELKILYSKTDFINKPDESDFYYIGVPCQSRAFEVTGYAWNWDDPRFSAEDFADLVDDDNFQFYEWERPDNHAKVEKRLVEWTRSYFRDENAVDTIDLPGSTVHRLGLYEITRLALPYESYQAVFTSTEELKKQLQDENFKIKFANTNDVLHQILQEEGGYHQESDIADYWWIPSGKQNFDSKRFFLSIDSQDPFGHKSSIAYDKYALLMTKAKDPLDNTIEAKNNYRVLQPYAVTDPNQNLTVERFDDLGLVAATAVMGKQTNGRWEGDYLNPDESEIHADDNPTTKIEYDLFRWMDLGKPAFVKTLAREKHKDVNTPWQESYLYSDGFGREVQTKVQAEPGEVRGVQCNKRWVGTGRKIYNNKGKPVKQYEPFFSITYKYEDEAEIVETGVTPVLFYDPLERVVCTIHPNDTYEKVIFDPWQQITWDVNDTVLLDPRTDSDISGYTADFLADHDAEYIVDNPGETPQTWYQRRVGIFDDTDVEKISAIKTKEHAGTPGIAYLDSLGRPFLSIADNGKDENDNSILFKTRIKLDIEGNDLAIIDPREVVAFQHRFDIAGRNIFVNSVDAGRSAVLTDIAGNPLRTQDANGNWTLVKYDELRRPTETVAHRTAPYDDAITSQVMVYGESLNKVSAIKNNHLGKVYAVFDGAGALFNLSYDFKGNLKKSIRRLSKKYKSDEIEWKDIVDIDFSVLDDEIAIKLNNLDLLEEEAFFTTTCYDALNRITESTAPDHSLFTPVSVEPTDGSIYKYGYNAANLLEKVSVHLKDEAEPQEFVSNINYNAKGQREEIVYGNKVETTYTYDPLAFRLVDLVSKRNNGRGRTLQSLHYTYDPVGNITSIRDDAHETIFNQNTKIEPVTNYVYDPTYRLIQASGREHESMSPCHYQSSNSKQTEIHTFQSINNSKALCTYTQNYIYDKSGNMERISHINSDLRMGNHNRYQTYDTNSNRILNSQAKKPDPNHQDNEIATCPNEKIQIQHDLNGNIIKLSHQDMMLDNDPPMQWNDKNQLIAVRLNDAADPDMAYYQYDAGGQRVRKRIVRNQGQNVEERIYLGGFEVYRKYKTNSLEKEFERQTLHVMDDKQRIALVETVTAGDPEARRFRYQLNNHLRSSSMELDETPSAKIISYEEYYPYGGTAYIVGRSEGSVIAPEVKRKRYRYSGKERDDETGLYYYGARYYAPWMGRWMSCDPAGIKDGLNCYTFVQENPIKLIDPSGMKSDEIGILPYRSDLHEDLDHVYEGTYFESSGGDTWFSYINEEGSIMLGSLPGLTGMQVDMSDELQLRDIKPIGQVIDIDPKFDNQRRWNLLDSNKKKKPTQKKQTKITEYDFSHASTIFIPKPKKEFTGDPKRVKEGRKKVRDDWEEIIGSYKKAAQNPEQAEIAEGVIKRCETQRDLGLEDYDRIMKILSAPEKRNEYKKLLHDERIDPDKFMKNTPYIIYENIHNSVRSQLYRGNGGQYKSDFTQYLTPSNRFLYPQKNTIWTSHREYLITRYYLTKK